MHSLRTFVILLTVLLLLVAETAHAQTGSNTYATPFSFGTEKPQNLFGTRNEAQYTAFGGGQSGSFNSPATNLYRRGSANTNGAGLTLANYVFGMHLEGGNAEATYNLVGMIQSDSSYTGLAGKNDAVAVAGLCESNAKSRCYGIYGEARLNGNGEAANELQVKNNSGNRARRIQDGLGDRSTTGLAVVGAGSGNSVGVLIQGDFQTGVYFQGGTVSEIAVDLSVSGANKPLVLPNGTYFDSNGMLYIQGRPVTTSASSSSVTTSAAPVITGTPTIGPTPTPTATPTPTHKCSPRKEKKNECGS